MAYASTQVSVPTTSAVLIWQTSTGVSPDPATFAQGGTAQIFQAHSFNDALPIVVENLDGTNPVYLGGSTVTSSTGTRLAGGASLTFNVAGNQSLYARATGASVAVSVLVGGT